MSDYYYMHPSGTIGLSPLYSPIISFSFINHSYPTQNIYCIHPII